MPRGGRRECHVEAGEKSATWRQERVPRWRQEIRVLRGGRRECHVGGRKEECHVEAGESVTLEAGESAMWR